MVTVLLLNYQRKDNILKILQTLKSQTVPCEIFLWNNAPEPFEDERVDWVINSGKNAVCWPRWFMGQYATNDFVMTLDDDLNFTTNDALETLINGAKKHYEKGRIVGLYGIQVNDPENYFPSKNEKRLGGIGLKKVNKSVGLPSKDTPVDVVKGRCMVVHKNDLAALPMVTDFCYNCDDIVASHFVAQGQKRHHLIIKGMEGKLENYEEMDGEMALSSLEGWKDRRSNALSRYFKNS